jgi:hypothetical protein
MARTQPDGSVWGRAEAVDSLGWRPGRGRRITLAVLGTASLLAGAYLGTTTSMTAPVAPAAFDPDAGYNALANEPTCASVGVVIPADRVPAPVPPPRGEDGPPTPGIPAGLAVALYRAEASGESALITPRAHVLSSEENPDGSLDLSVLVRMGPLGDDQQVAEVAAASAAGALVVAVLYDVDPIRVLNECREG